MLRIFVCSGMILYMDAATVAARMKGQGMATKAQMLSEAEKIEAHAKESLQAWAICGQTEKYGQYMEKASNLRRAAELKGYARREFMQNKGLA